MVKTLIKLKDEIYKKLIDLSIKKFGHPRGISKIINEILEKELNLKKKKYVPKYTIRIGRRLTISEVNKIRKEAWRKMALKNIYENDKSNT